MGSYLNKRRNQSRNFSSKQLVISLITLLLFVFLCIPFDNFIYNVLLGFFGISIYPILLILTLVEYAIASKRKFTMQKRNVLLLISVSAVLLCLLHTIFSSNLIDSYEIISFSTYGKYLKDCFMVRNNLTVGGLLLGLIVYPVVVLAGTVGASIIFAIAFVLLVAVTLDYYINKQSYLTKLQNRKKALNKNYENMTNFTPTSDSISQVTNGAISSSVIVPKKVQDDEYVGYLNPEEKMDPTPKETTYNTILSTLNNNPEPIEEYNIPEPRKATNSAIETLYGNKVYDNSTDNSLLTDDKATSNYDPNKFSSLEEYINYPYVPDQFKTKNNLQNNALFPKNDSNLSNIDKDSRILPQDDPNTFADLGQDINEKVTPKASSFDRFTKSILDSEKSKYPSLSDFDADETNDDDNTNDYFSSNDFVSRESRHRGPDREQRKSPERIRPVYDFSAKVEPEQTSLPFGKETISRPLMKDERYQIPPTSLMQNRSDDESSYGSDYIEKSKALEGVLSSFKIDARVSAVIRGPSVTRYELTMPIGISVKRVLQYDSDIASVLKSRGGVRIEAPILGKNAVGVEVPNDKKSTVGLRELLEAKEFVNSSAALPVVIGKSISGDVIVKSLPKMIHLLVGGSTGSGKSIFLHSIILSLLYKCSPDQLKFIMIDPKRVELINYTGMPHMLLPQPVCECDKAINALSWAVKEMERRYKVFNECAVQNIEDYNHSLRVTSGELPKLYYIVIVIDELADLMMVGKREVEEKIMRLSQLARASGIHMIIATQRPSADIITGTIKNNMPTRVTFKLGSQIDSRVIMDESGAEKLLGAGDMLIKPIDSPVMLRLQGGFMLMDEVRKIVQYIKEHNSCYFDDELEKEILSDKNSNNSNNGQNGESSDPELPDIDELMPAALRLVISAGGASINMIQRRFRVGYARAARIIDQMELAQYVSPANGSKLRTVFITMDQYHEIFGEDD